MNYLLQLILGIQILLLCACDESSSSGSGSTVPRTGGVNGVTFYSVSTTMYGYDEDINNSVTLSLPIDGATQLGVKVEQSYSATSSYVESSSSSGYVEVYVGLYDAFSVTTTSGIMVNSLPLSVGNNTIEIRPNTAEKSYEVIFAEGLKKDVEEPVSLHSASVNTYPWRIMEFDIVSVEFNSSSCNYEQRATNSYSVASQDVVSAVNNIYKQGIVVAYDISRVLNRTYNLDPQCDGSLEMVFDKNGHLQYSDQLNLLLNSPRDQRFVVFHVPQIDMKLARDISDVDLDGTGMYVPNLTIGMMNNGSSIEFHPFNRSINNSTGEPWEILTSTISRVSYDYNYIFLNSTIPYNFPLDHVVIKNVKVYGWSSEEYRIAIVRDRNPRSFEFEKNVAHELGHLLGLEDDNTLPTNNLMHQGDVLGTYLNSNQWDKLHP